MKIKNNKTILADNRKARFDYEIIEAFEAGIELFGEEVKKHKKWFCKPEMIVCTPLEW